jgi:hypothetical protein
MENLLGGADPLDEIVAELRKYDGWPADDVRDRQFAKELLDKYPGLDLKSEAFQWRTWMLDHQQKREVKPRARFVRWVVNAATFRSERTAVRKNRTHTSRTAPARAEAFGSQSSTELAGW